MPEIIEVFNNNAAFPVVLYESEWLNISSSNNLVFTVFSDVDYDYQLMWAVDDNFDVIQTQMFNNTGGNTSEIFTPVKTRFVRFIVELSSAPAILRTQGFFFTKSDILTFLESASGVSLVNSGASNPLLIKGLDAGTNINLTDNGNTVTISVTGIPLVWKQVDDVISPITTTQTNFIVGQGNNSIDINNESSAIIASTGSTITNTETIRSTIISGEDSFISGTAQRYDCLLSGWENQLTGDKNIISSGAIGGTDNILDSTSLQPNSNDIQHSYIIGGTSNRILSIDGSVNQSCILGGNSNEIRDRIGSCAILGGSSNLISSAFTRFCSTSCIVGGNNNDITGDGSIFHSGILLGENNTINLAHGTDPNPIIRRSVILSSNNSTLNSECEDSVIVGGKNHTLGSDTTTTTFRSICIGGENGTVIHDDSFLFTSGMALSTTADNTFTVKASGGSTFYSNNNATTGVFLASGSSSWASVCDAFAKENLLELDYDDVLSRVDVIPIYIYNYIGNPTQQTNMGPCAQDFHAQFPCDDIPDGMGGFDPAKDTTKIEVMDVVGVCLASIKSLSDTNKQQQIQIDDLLARVTALEAV